MDNILSAVKSLIIYLQFYCLKSFLNILPKLDLGNSATNVIFFYAVNNSRQCSKTSFSDNDSQTFKSILANSPPTSVANIIDKTYIGAVGNIMYQLVLGGFNSKYKVTLIEL